MGDKRILRALGAVHDLLVAAIAFYLAFSVYYGIGGVFSVPGIHDKAAGFVVIAGASFYFASLNRGSWRYASIPDLISIIRGSFYAVAGFTIAIFLVARGENLPRVAMPLCFLFLVVGLSGPRLAYRLVKELKFFGLQGKSSAENAVRYVLLYGATENAESFIRRTKMARNSMLHVAGIIDDRQPKGMHVQGVRVLGNLSALPDLVQRFALRGQPISEIAITSRSTPSEELKAVIAQSTSRALRVTRIPDFSETSDISRDRFDTKPIELRDLLGRPEVSVDTMSVATLIQDKVLMITGAGGSIGSELVRQAAVFRPKQIVLVDASEYFLYTIDTQLRETHPDLAVITRIADIRDRQRVDALIRTYKPDVLIHAAALKHVPLMEKNVIESMKTNVIGTRNLADSAVTHGVRTFVMISTDKAVNPTSVMGATKRAAEAYCQLLDIEGAATRFKTVRFGNVLGSNGSVVPRFEAQIAKGGPVTVTHPEIVRFFMTIPEAARLVLQAAGHGMRRAEDRGRILVLDMGEPVRIADLARRMIELAGLKPEIDIKIEYTGLRPGEKLYEELLDADEQLDAANGKGYMLASPRSQPRDVLLTAIGRIEKAIAANDEAGALAALRDIVPEFTTPNHTVAQVVPLVRNRAN